MRMLKGAISTFLFLSQLQCCNAALKRGTASLQPATGLQAHGTELSVVGRRSASPDGKAVAGRRKFSYLVALQEWQRVTKTGVHCPKPEACECHCDCPNTVATGQTPTSPPACPVFPSFPLPPTPAPTTKPTSKIYKNTPAPKPKVKCKEGQVQLSDGTCKFIDMGVINQLLKLVDLKKNALVAAQQNYNAQHQPNCTSCPGATAYYDMRLRLIEAHTQYRAALGLFLNALGWLKDSKEKVGLGDKKKGPGKEFIPGVKEYRSHCEPWTVNGTKKPKDEICAIICRNQPSCVGFARDPENKWCLWFDDAKPESKNVCSTQTKTKFLKNWQGPVNHDMWVSMEKIHVFDKAIVEALKLAGTGFEHTNRTFVGWWGFDEGQNESIKLELKDTFLDNMDDYTGTILDTAAIRKQYKILEKAANGLANKEALINPALDAPAPVMKDEAEPVQISEEGFKSPTEDEPSTLRWKDFPNSEDTAWSKIHPDCPMGTPCYCDCKCRGAPPQNFVEPPPLPAPPCPLPPPLPNPAALTAILR